MSIKCLYQIVIVLFVNFACSKRKVYLCDLGSCGVKRLEFTTILNYIRASFAEFSSHK